MNNPSNLPGKAANADRRGPAQAADVKSAGRVLDILELLSLQAEPMRLTAVVEELGYPKSSTHALLNTLINRGYVVRDRADCYALADNFGDGLAWGGGVEAVLRRYALPIMTAARDETGETVFLCVRGENQDARQICKVVSDQPIRYDSSGATAVPAYASVMGRVLLAYSDPDTVDTYFANVELLPFTEHTLTDEMAIREVLERIRHDGYGTIEEEYAIGGCGLAAPVRNRTGRVVAVMDIATVSQRYEACKADMLDCLLRATETLSARLGYRPQHGHEE